MKLEKPKINNAKHINELLSNHESNSEEIQSQSEKRKWKTHTEGKKKEKKKRNERDGKVSVEAVIDRRWQ